MSSATFVAKLFGSSLFSACEEVWVPRAVHRIAATDTCWEVGAPVPARTPRVSLRTLNDEEPVRTRAANRPPVVTEAELIPVPRAVADSATPLKRATRLHCWA